MREGLEAAWAVEPPAAEGGGGGGGGGSLVWDAGAAGRRGMQGRGERRREGGSRERMGKGGGKGVRGVEKTDM